MTAKELMTDRGHIFWPALYAVLLISSIVGLFSIAIVGTNPYHAGHGTTFDQAGIERHDFYRGEWVYVRRSVCIDQSIFAEQSPSLYDVDRRAYIPLPITSTIAAKGCLIRSSGFVVPPTLPTGTYEYRNVSRFQNNLIGRDEVNLYPPIAIRVLA